MRRRQRTRTALREREVKAVSRGLKRKAGSVIREKTEVYHVSGRGLAATGTNKTRTIGPASALTLWREADWTGMDGWTEWKGRKLRAEGKPRKALL